MKTRYNPKSEKSIGYCVAEAIKLYNKSLCYEGTSLQKICATRGDVVVVNHGNEKISQWYIGKTGVVSLFDKVRDLESLGEHELRVIGHSKNESAERLVEDALHPDNFLKRFGLVEKITEEEAA